MAIFLTVNISFLRSQYINFYVSDNFTVIAVNLSCSYEIQHSHIPPDSLMQV